MLHIEAKSQVSDRINLFRSSFVLSQVRRKDKDAPNLGHPQFVQSQAVRDLATKCTGAGVSGEILRGALQLATPILQQCLRDTGILVSR